MIKVDLSEDVNSRVVLILNQKRNYGRPIEKRKKLACERLQVGKYGKCGESSHNYQTYRNMVPLN